MSNLKNSFFVGFWLLNLGFLVNGCSNDLLDESEPTIQIESPGVNDTFLTGTSIPIRLIMSDNSELNSYKVELKTLSGTETPCTQELTRQINGQNTEVELALDISSQCPSNSYELKVFCSDRLENHSETITIPIEIINSIDNSSPELVITNPDPEGLITVFSGGNLVLFGEVNDDVGLEHISIRMEKQTGIAYGDDKTIDLDGALTYSIIEIIELPENAGIYFLYIEAFDQYNNSSIQLLKLNVI